MHICLFGSAFDPVHIGHQYMAEQMLCLKLCDEVWFVPVNQHPFGKKVEANGRRVEMLKLVIREQSPDIREKLKICSYELEKDGKSYSFDTLESLATQYPEHTFSWLIGSDNLQHFHLWKDYSTLLEKYRVWVFPRKGFPMHPWYPGMNEVTGVEEIEVSSTQIRDRLAKKISITGLVHPEIERYIQENHLYL